MSLCCFPLWSSIFFPPQLGRHGQGSAPWPRVRVRIMLSTPSACQWAICKATVLASQSTPLSSFQSGQTTARVSGLRLASTLSHRPALPHLCQSPVRPTLCLMSYSRRSQNITAGRAWPSPGVSDDAAAEGDAAVEGHRADVRQSWGQGPGLHIPVCVLFWCPTDRLSELCPTFSREVGHGAQGEHCGVLPKP